MLRHLLIAVIAASFSLPAQDAALKPYEMVWKVDGTTAADVSFLLDAPAGKDGFIRIENGRLVDGTGKRFRIWGVNFSFVANLPDKENAPHVAAHLARFGVNCVRIHHLDWRTPRGIIDSRHPDSQHLDPEKLDRLDFLVSELKKRGIYVNINLNVARAFQEADGVVDAGQLGFAKAVTLFDPRMIELQKDYARQILTHRNPYTGNEYRNEPAVAIVEIVNENSMIESWVRGRLLGRGPQPGSADPTWTDITGHYEKALTALYQKWLAEQNKPELLAKLSAEAGVAAGAPVPRLRPDQFKESSDLRFQTEAAFYIDVETRFYEWMKQYLKGELGVKAPLVGTSAHSGGLSPYPLLSSISGLDIIDTHVYWQHPRYSTDPATARRISEIPNTPMVNEPEKSTVVTLHRSAFVGMPFTVSEVNHPYPNEWAAEMIPILAAYASYLDWDGIFWYSFEHSEAKDWVSKFPGAFDIRQDPVKMSQLAAGALLFLRGDVAQARKVSTRSYSQDQVRESLRMPSSTAPNFTPGMAPGLALTQDVRIATLHGDPFCNLPDVKAPYVTDTRELTWDVRQGKGVVSIDTPRTQGLVGFLREGRPASRHLAAEIENPFAAMLLASMDGKPIVSATKLLLTAGARTGNTGMRWNGKRTILLENGTGPMLIEPVTGSVLLKGLGKVSGVQAQALDGAGNLLGAPVPALKVSSGWRLPLGGAVTPWYLVTLER